jgi:hypothetical protein
VALKNMPQLRFELDHSLKESARVYEAIERARERTGPAPEPAEDETGIEIDPPAPDEPRPGPEC